MCRYKEYTVIYVNEREDGRIERVGSERLVLTPEEIEELSWSAIIVTGMSMGGMVNYVHEGRHAQADGRNGWIS